MARRDRDRPLPLLLLYLPRPMDRAMTKTMRMAKKRNITKTRMLIQGRAVDAEEDVAVFGLFRSVLFCLYVRPLVF